MAANKVVFLFDVDNTLLERACELARVLVARGVVRSERALDRLDEPGGRIPGDLVERLVVGLGEAGGEDDRVRRLDRRDAAHALVEDRSEREDVGGRPRVAS